MIRMKLNDFNSIDSLHFDIPGRILDIFHTGSHDNILAALESLQLGARLISSGPAETTGTTGDQHRERKALWQVLAINFFFFVLEMLTGLIAGSMGLIADSLDMLADSIVYGLSLFAVGGTMARKKTIAAMAGYFQLFLALMGFIEVIRRSMGYGETPDFHLMILISLLALAGNAICLFLLQKAKSREAHMQASMIFTSNDIIINIGVVLAGIGVYLTSSRVPDLVVGTIVFILVVKGAMRILRLSQ